MAFLPCVLISCCFSIRIQFYAKVTYMIIISVLGLATLAVVLLERFSRPEYRKYRAALFISLGLISGLPIFHFSLINGMSQALNLASLHYMVLMGALYIIGALVKIWIEIIFHFIVSQT